MVKTLIYLENFSNSFKELITVSERLGDSELYAVCLCDEVKALQPFFDHIITTDLLPFQVENLVNLLVNLNRKYDFDRMLFFRESSNIASRVAVELETGLTADVTEIRDGALIRPAFEGKILAAIVNKENARPLMATIRPNVFPLSTKNVTKVSQIISKNFSEQAKNQTIELLSTREKPKSTNIKDAKILVSFGGGIGENFQNIAEPLAKLLNGQAAASRALVDSGIAPRSIQVGQSGKTVSPKLYMALGIHGSLQHVVGLKGVQHIISVNTDQLAPINAIADVVVEGDAVDFAEKLGAKIKGE